MIAGAEATRSGTWLLTQLVAHRNCRHWQLWIFATVDLRVLLPTRHAPKVSRPASNPNRPQSCSYTALTRSLRERFPSVDSHGVLASCWRRAVAALR